MGRLVDNGSVAWVPLHVTALAAVAEQDEGIAIRVRKLREQGEKCSSNSAARGVAEEAVLRLGRSLHSRAAELKSFYESIILEDVSVLFERERLRLQRLITVLEAPLAVRAPIKPLPVNGQDTISAQNLGALLFKKVGGALATVHSAPSTPKGTSRRHQSFVAPPEAPPVLQLPAKPALRLQTLRGTSPSQNGPPSPLGGLTSPRGPNTPRTSSPPPSSLRPGPAYVRSPLQGVSFPEPEDPPAAPSGRKQSKKRSFAVPDDAFSCDPSFAKNDARATDCAPGTSESGGLDVESRLPSSTAGPIEESGIPESLDGASHVVELVVKLTAEEYEEVMILARERTRKG